MKLIFLLLLLPLGAFAQRSHTIDADCLRIKDGTCVDKTELGRLDGLSGNIQTQIDGKVGTSGNESVSGIKTFTGKITASSTTNGFRPCPSMTEVQRDAIVSPATGDCVYNTTALTLNVYNGSTWKSAGGGINQWTTATGYQLDDVVIESSKFYICISAHTSATFATDLSGGKWQLLHTLASDAVTFTNKTIDADQNTITNIENADIKSGAAIDAAKIADGSVSSAEFQYLGSVTSDIQTQINGKEPSITVLSLAKGGTNKNMTAANGGVVYTDADSQEVTAAGTSNQVLRSNGAAAPTWSNRSIVGSFQTDIGSPVTLENLRLPNSQLTDRGSNVYLAETGNKNLLANASMEAPVSGGASPSWNLTNGTIAAESTVVIEGAQSLLLTVNNGTNAEFFQTSTRYAAQFADGVQGVASMRIKTAASGLFLCSVQNSTFQLSNCATVNNDSKWMLYKVPFVFGSGNNGIVLVSGTMSNGVVTQGAVSGTATIYVDDAYVGTDAGIADVDASRLAGEAYFVGTTNCGSWTRTNTALGAVASDADCPGPTIVTSTLGNWQTTDADLPRVTVNNLPAGRYKAKFYFYQLTSGGIPAAAINDGTTTCEAVNTNQDTGSYVGQVVECTFVYTTGGNRTFELYVASTSGTVTVLNSTTAPRGSLKFILEYFASAPVIATQCGANCENVLSAAAASGGTVSAENVDFINGNCSISATSTFTCTPNTGTFSVTPNCGCSRDAGDGECHYIRASSSSTSLVFITENSAGSATAGAITFWCQKQGADYQSSRTIVGSFKVPEDEVTVDSGNGHGSTTGTKIRRWTNTRKNSGSCITYADSSTAGGSFTIGPGNCAGNYSVSCHDRLTTNNAHVGITVNDSAMTTNVSTPLTYAQGLRAYSNCVSGAPCASSWTGYLAAGDIVRLHTNGTNDSGDSQSMCTVKKVSL